MSDSPPIYDLVLLLDPGVDDDARAKIVADARAAIEADGALLGDQPWGMRALAYPIAHRNQAEYHLLQFSGPPTLIAGLQHSLRITDGVVRHRVIKRPAGASPVSADSHAPASGGTGRAAHSGTPGRGAERHGGRGAGGSAAGDSDPELART